MKFVTDKRRHLICVPYTIENLHKMADELRINRCWFHNSKHPHYDIPKRRQAEIEEFCWIVTTKELINLIKTAEQ